MDFLSTLQYEWLLHNHLDPLLCLSIPLIKYFINYGMIKKYSEKETPYFPTNQLFSIA